MSEFHGFMFSKLHLIGSKSEGPSYSLQQFDYSEIPIAKQAELWEEDPNLQKELGKKVTVAGELSSGRLQYDKIIPYSPPGKTGEPEPCLKVALKLETNELCINKMPPSPPPRPFKMTLEVEWPYRSVWKGICPTSQVYDFFVEFDGKLIWQWSKGKFFLQALTPIAIPGGNPHAFSETWIIEPDILPAEGAYTVRGLFIASGQEDEQKLDITFAE